LVKKTEGILGVKEHEGIDIAGQSHKANTPKPQNIHLQHSIQGIHAQKKPHKPNTGAIISRIWCVFFFFGHTKK
jgi:hypothetical protein